MEFLFDIILDALIDSIKLVPFLFITYLIMEAIEHRTTSHSKLMIKKAGRFGPIVGAIAGMLPQCGFSTVASNFYAGRIISMGTLIAIFLSTSDEMLPIMLSEAVNPVVIAKILGIKVVIGMVAGLLIDFIICHNHKEDNDIHVHEMCEHEHCRCDEGIIKPSLVHTAHITFFIFAISLVLNGIIEFVGEEIVMNLFLAKPVIGQLIAGLIGLIPNCAASVIITQLYLDGIMGLGAMMAGLLTGAGVGVLVLFKVNKSLKENIFITFLLYAIGVIVGTIIELLGFVI